MTAHALADMAPWIPATRPGRIVRIWMTVAEQDRVEDQQ